MHWVMLNPLPVPTVPSYRTLPEYYPAPRLVSLTHDEILIEHRLVVLTSGAAVAWRGHHWSGMGRLTPNATVTLRQTCAHLVPWLDAHVRRVAAAQAATNAGAFYDSGGFGPESFLILHQAAIPMVSLTAAMRRSPPLVALLRCMDQLYARIVEPAPAEPPTLLLRVAFPAPAPAFLLFSDGTLVSDNQPVTRLPTGRLTELYTLLAHPESSHWWDDWAVKRGLPHPDRPAVAVTWTPTPTDERRLRAAADAHVPAGVHTLLTWLAALATQYLGRREPLHGRKQG